MKSTIALILPFITAVVATPMVGTDDSALAAREPSPPPGCNYVIECNSSDTCQGFECARAGYSCDSGSLTLGYGFAPNATCTADCWCSTFCGIGPVTSC
ncbi:hypothetical protein MSAN_01946100 [Mycena sanguinolenta]|uniref:Uncharacterized protein n=1 Tax=Mycena sanguinolenta TaxID=230812 RepID=A0A8H6XL52_9AGAR|nr:hypothetical protein MSAN_01946100 [Mycena sanguinolenta]